MVCVRNSFLYWGHLLFFVHYHPYHMWGMNVEATCQTEAAQQRLHAGTREDAVCPLFDVTSMTVFLSFRFSNA